MTGHMAENKPTRVLVGTLRGNPPHDHFDAGQPKNLAHM